MGLPILYSFRRCPYAMRARMALDVSGIRVEHREVALRNKPDAMLKASPKGTVPVLVTEDGKVIDESLEIMIWALDRNDPEGWLEAADADSIFVDTFLSEFKTVLDRYKYASRYDPEARRGDVDTAHRGHALDLIETHFVPLESRPFLGGGSPRLADMATFPFVRQFANVEPDWWRQSAPAGTRRWLTGLVESPRFQRIMGKHDLWKPDQG
ncbi:MAG: glutathione S-transferase N-terminal domain-containing protein [Litorimonas sp.]